jgi:putative phosphoesterase
MKIAIISDVHGNSIALDQCFEYLEKNCFIDQTYFLGDSVGYFPDSNRVIDKLIEKDCICLLGNHDAMMIGELDLDNKKDEVYRISKFCNSVSKENKVYIGSLNSFREESIANKKVLFVHGSPDNSLEGYVYPDSDFSKIMDNPYDIIFMGHTHYPFIKENNDKVFVNVGSVGLSRDTGNWQSFAIFDTNLMSIELVRLKLNSKAILDSYQDRIHVSVKKVLNRNNLKNKEGDEIFL